MTDRGASAANPRAGPNRITRAATNAAGVRRNLFQSQLTRRPTSTETTTRSGSGSGEPSGTSTYTSNATTRGRGTAAAVTTATAAATSSRSASAETLRLGVDVAAPSESSEIVIRDRNGEFEFGDPPAACLDDSDDVGALDDAQENERERQKLAEAVRHHQIDHTRMPAQPEEVMETLKASMKAQVAALAEDNWMYEAEDPPRVH